MRGLSRLLVVGFTIVSLMLVAAVGVSATSGKSDQVKNSVVTLVTHVDQVISLGAKSQSKDSKGGGNKGDECKPPKKTDKHHHATAGHKHHPCGDDDSD